MKIGIDASLASMRGTGTGRYAAQLLAQLLELDRHNEYFLYFNRRDVRENPLLHVRAPNIHARVIHAPFTLARVHVSLSVSLRRDRVELYHSLGFFLPWFWRGKAVVTIHDIHPVLFPGYWNRPGGRRSYFTLRTHIPLALKRATRILTPSEYTRQTICQRFGVSPARIVVTPEAADPFFFAPPAREDVEAMERRFGAGEFFLNVGALAPHKNLTGLIEAFARLRQRAVPRHVRLVLVGRSADGYWKRSLRPLVDRLDLAGAVTLTEYVDETTLRALYRKAIAVILPSFAEGFGLPVLEAMACGTPVVISRTGALGEVAGDAALRVDPHDPEELARAMQRMLDEPDLRGSLIASGRSRAASFSWERTARQTLETYEQADAAMTA